jgi:hypothetical protein
LSQGSLRYLPPTCSIGVAANALALALAFGFCSDSSCKNFSSIREQLERMINRREARSSHILFVFIIDIFKGLDFIVISLSIPYLSRDIEQIKKK